VMVVGGSTMGIIIRVGVGRGPKTGLADIVTFDVGLGRKISG